jgi:hypothetical protein
MSDGKKIQINEGVVKKGNTNTPPLSTRPPAPQPQSGSETKPSSRDSGKK